MTFLPPKSNVERHPPLRTAPPPPKPQPVYLNRCDLCGKNFKTRVADGMPTVCPWGCDKGLDHLFVRNKGLEGRMI